MEDFLEERFVEMAGRHSKPEKEPGQHGRAVQGRQFIHQNWATSIWGTSGGSQSLAVVTQHDNIS